MDSLDYRVGPGPLGNRTMLNNAQITRRVGLAILIGICTIPLHAETVAQKSSVAAVGDDAEVLGAERLVSAWIEGQIAYRGLPGVVIGVVSDQELIWSKSFGFAGIKTELPVSAATKVLRAAQSQIFTAHAIIEP